MTYRDEGSEKRHRVWLFASGLAGSLLAAAAALKLLATPTVTGSWQPSFAAWPLVIAIETILALWLLSGRQAHWARPVAVAMFATFAAISSARAWSGDESCGCFGAVAVPPAWMATIDTAVLCLLLVARPLAPARRAGLLARPAGIVVGLAILAAIVQANGLSTALAEKEYEPRSGQPWPLVDELRATVDIGHGESYVVLYRADCQHCRKFLSELAESDARVRHRVVLVEVRASLAAHDAQAAAERLWSLPMLPWVATRHDIPVRTPAVVLVRDGVVAAVRSPAAEESPDATVASLVPSPDLL